MQIMIKRVVISGCDNGPEPIKTGIEIVAALIKDNPNDYSNIAIYIPSLAQLSATTLEQALGPSVTKSLKKGPVKLTASSTLRVTTSRTLKNPCGFDAIIAVYADQKMMDIIDGCRPIKAIIALPYKPDAIDTWIKTWNPVIHGKPLAPPGPIINNGIIREALTTLTSLINLGNRVLNPRDEEAAKDILKILRRHNENEPIENIRAWAINNGWHPTGADELCKHAKRILNLKSKPKLSSSTWAADIYKQWSTRAKSQ